MQRTRNYQLPQWEMEDRIMMKDFNEMCSNNENAIDGAKSEARTSIEAAKSEDKTAVEAARSEASSGIAVAKREASARVAGKSRRPQALSPRSGPRRT